MKLVFGVLLFLVVSVFCQTFYFGQSSWDTSVLSIVGSSSYVVGEGMVLTTNAFSQSGTVWYLGSDGNGMSLTSGFTSTIEFTIGDNLNGGADGFSFIFQSSGPSVLGSSGGGVGYEGIVDSVAIEFDTWDNGLPGDPNANHVEVHSCGPGLANSASSCLIPGLTSGTSLPITLEDGFIHRLVVDYDPTTLYLGVTLDGGLLFSSNTFDINNYENPRNGRAWVGFSASTGGAASRHTINTWGHVKTPLCGDDFCDINEDSLNCPSDCTFDSCFFPYPVPNYFSSYPLNPLNVPSLTVAYDPYSSCVNPTVPPGAIGDLWFSFNSGPNNLFELEPCHPGGIAIAVFTGDCTFPVCVGQNYYPPGCNVFSVFSVPVTPNTDYFYVITVYSSTQVILNSDLSTTGGIGGDPHGIDLLGNLFDIPKMDRNYVLFANEKFQVNVRLNLFVREFSYHVKGTDFIILGKETENGPILGYSLEGRNSFTNLPLSGTIEIGSISVKLSEKLNHPSPVLNELKRYHTFGMETDDIIVTGGFRERAGTFFNILVKDSAKYSKDKFNTVLHSEGERVDRSRGFDFKLAEVAKLNTFFQE